MVQTDAPLQAIEGFGACFNELGWTSLSALTAADRDSVLRELFAPGVGASFTLCRMPVGANDFSRDWYSYDETDGDFALEHFSIANDLETLVPFIQAALAHQPALKLWASPWSPPTWMKTNQHYAMAMPGPWQKGVENGLRPDQVGNEGTDMFIQEERYLRAYAAYFGRFIDEYRELGITIGMVMPQNEFNSAQVFPSCTWTAEGLARFIAHLGPEMAKRGVAVFFGTMERANEQLVDVSLQDPAVAPLRQGRGLPVGGQGRHRRHPPPLPGAAALPDRAGVRRRPERLALLPLRLVADEALPAERRERLPLLEHLAEEGRGQPLGLGAELARHGGHRREDVRLHARVLPAEAPEPLRAAGRAARRGRELERLREPARLRATPTAASSS